MKRLRAAGLVLCASVVCAIGAEPEARETVEVVREVLHPAEIRQEQGFCFIATPGLGRAGDQEARSVCTLMEDGKPIGPSRALHAAIRTEGKGRYSHWSPTALYFSASDNSDPRTNGREYALVSRRRVVRRSFERVFQAAEARYRVEAAAGRPVANRRVTLRNLDATAAAVFHLRGAGWPDLSSTEGILGSILPPGADEERKALAIWKFLVDWRYHYYPAEEGDEIHDPVKFINVYGYGFCDDCAENFAVLCRAAGIRARIWGLDGHVVGEAFYGGRWHMFDPDHEVVYRSADGKIASVEDLAADPSPITATPRDPIGSDSAAIAKLYTSTRDNRPGERKVAAGARLDPVLQPGDEVVFDLTDRDRSRRIAFPKESPAPVRANGRLLRRVPAVAAGQTAKIRTVWPYVLLGAELSLDPAREGIVAEVAIGDGAGPLGAVPAALRGAVLAADLTGWFEARMPAPYAYAIRVAPRGPADAGPALRGGVLTTWFQFAPRALPQVGAGGTEFVLRLAAPRGMSLPSGWRGVRVIHEWDEIAGDLPAGDSRAP